MPLDRTIRHSLATLDQSGQHHQPFEYEYRCTEHVYERTSQNPSGYFNKSIAQPQELTRVGPGLLKLVDFSALQIEDCKMTSTVGIFVFLQFEGACDGDGTSGEVGGDTLY